MKNIYLIKSDSFYLLNNKISELTEGIEEISKFDLDDIELKDVISDGSYGSLFNDKKAILITNCKYFGGKFLYEEETDILYNFLSNIDENTVIIIVCNELQASKQITKKVVEIGSKLIDLTTLSEEDILKYINDVLNNNSIKMNESDIKVLLKRVGNNIDLFLSEVFKISVLTKNITLKDIENYSSYNEEDVTFDFSNAVITKNFKEVFELLDKLIAKGVEMNSLVGLLASSYTTMYIVKDAMANGLSDEDIEHATGFKSGRIYINKKLGRIYTLDDLKDILTDLCLVDKKIKTGSNPVYIFKEFLLNI